VGGLGLGGWGGEGVGWEEGGWVWMGEGAGRFDESDGDYQEQRGAGAQELRSRGQANRAEG
jgi:hypothetical protein